MRTSNNGAIFAARTFSAFMMAALIFLSQAFICPSAKAETARSPEAVASEFYGWYLKAFSADQNPLDDDRKRLSTYVSTALLAEITRKMTSEDGLDADYFIQAQDYLDDWVTNIAVEKSKAHGSTATVIVVLGATDASRHKLSVTMAKEKNFWKIRRVSPA